MLSQQPTSPSTLCVPQAARRDKARFAASVSDLTKQLMRAKQAHKVDPRITPTPATVQQQLDEQRGLEAASIASVTALEKQLSTLKVCLACSVRVANCASVGGFVVVHVWGGLRSLHLPLLLASLSPSKRKNQHRYISAWKFASSPHSW